VGQLVDGGVQNTTDTPIVSSSTWELRRASTLTPAVGSVETKGPRTSTSKEAL